MTHNIVIVDDHILIAKAIASIVNEHLNYQVLYEVSNRKMLMEKMANAKNIPDIVLLDISMPIMNGFETAAWLKLTHPDVLILTLSMQDDDDSLIKMIKAGAKGYLLKNVEPNELIQALDALITKGYYFPDWAATKVFNNVGFAIEKGDDQKVKISDREKEFLSFVCTEYTYKEIAEKMYCSPRTVEGYRDALFDKLNLKSRVGLAMYAIKNGYYREG
ncbi:MAG: response regulator transcription factor [Bacteroidetes bacterium]|nr:response regulator transcription factor [Bacteroidota bacterium]